jgi:hypothetical protein
MVACAMCGSTGPPGARFCEVCGARLAAPAFSAHGAAPGVRVAKPIVPMVAAGGVGAIGALMLLGILTPFASSDGFSSSLSDGNGQLVFLIGLSALLCIGGCVSEFVSLREGLLVAIGISLSFSPAAGATIVGVTSSDLSPHIGFVLWAVAGMLGVAVVVLLFVGVLESSDRAPVPLPFSACCAGGGLLLTVGLLIPPPHTAFADHIRSDTPLLAAMNLLYAAVPLLIAVAALASPSRATLTLTLGVVSWYATSWILAATSRSAFGFGLFDEPSLAHYIQAVALTVLGLSAIGGGLVRWVDGAPRARSMRDYVLPITTCSTLVLVLLTGLVAGG